MSQTQAEPGGKDFATCHASPAVPAVQRMAAAGRCVAVDPFAGVGGNVIQMALRCERVIAVDNSPERLEICRHNAQVLWVLRWALCV